MPSTVSITPVVRKQAKKKNGTYPISIRVTFKRRSKLLSTNIVAEPHQLSRTLAISDPVLDEAVMVLVRRMRSAVNGLDPFLLSGMEVEDVVVKMEDILALAEGFHLDFPDYFEKIASEKGTKAGRANYMSALHALTAFIGKEHFDISVISSSLMRRFEHHLRDKYGDSARAVSFYTSTIATVHRRAREEYNNEESDEVLIKNPFDYYKCPRQQPADHRNIEEKIVKKMLKVREELTGRERIGVDLFLISFALMGMNTPDIYSCAPPKNGVIIYNRTKTKNLRPDKAEMHVRVEPCVKKLISEYRDRDGKHMFNFHRRYSTYENLAKAANLGLRAFSERVKGPHITVYSARHTFASVGYACGVSENIINDCLCHVDKALKTTAIYINKDWSVMWKANAKILSRFEWPV